MQRRDGSAWRPSAVVVGGLAVAGVAVVGLLAMGSDDGAVPDGRLEDARAIAAELDAWWRDAAPGIGVAYRSVAPDRVTDGTDGATCDGVDLDPDDEDLDGNAFVDEGCDEGLLVGIDVRTLSLPLELESTLAHEWGHVVQAMGPGIDVEEAGGLSIDVELQADCLAGAWAGDVMDDEQVETMVLRQRESGDEPGVPIDDVDAHGTGDERVAAFLHGVTGGPAACVGDALDVVLP